MPTLTPAERAEFTAALDKLTPAQRMGAAVLIHLAGQPGVTADELHAIGPQLMTSDKLALAAYAALAAETHGPA